MFIKIRTEFFHKNLFPFLIAASLAIHGIIIVLSPEAHQFLSLKSLRDSFVREPGEYAVMLELEGTDTQVKDASPDTQQEQNEAEVKKEKKTEPKKHKIFADDSDNAKDEQPSVESNKIGEKGSVAKDNFPDSNLPVNNEPHAEGHSKAPLLGRGGNPLPGDGQQQQQETSPQAFVQDNGTTDRNVPPRYANLPQGLEKPEEPAKPPRISPPQMETKEPEEKGTKAESSKPDTGIKPKTIQQLMKRERLTIGRGIEREDVAAPLPDNEGVLFPEKQDEINKESENKDESLTSLPQEAVIEKNDAETVKKPVETKETKDESALKPETPAPPSELPDVEPQRRLDRGLDEQESPGESQKPKVSFNVNAKTEGANKDPALFEDTISNAAISGAPSFNVQKHEYAPYFKHIRDRISLYWFLGYGTKAEIKLETRDDKPIIVEFKVMPDGSIEDVKITDDAGNFQLASRLVSSIEKAAPLNPFPVNIKEPSIDVKFNFYFF